MGTDETSGDATEVREFQFTQDATAVAEILRQSRAATLWTQTDLLLLRSLSGATAFVSVNSGRVSGVLIARTAADEAEILNLAVGETERRRGAGRKLIQHLLDEYRRLGITRVFLEVRESNRGAIAFYETIGFRHIGRRKGYYYDPIEDALVMEHRIEKSTVSPP